MTNVLINSNNPLIQEFQNLKNNIHPVRKNEPLKTENVTEQNDWGSCWGNHLSTMSEPHGTPSSLSILAAGYLLQLAMRFKRDLFTLWALFKGRDSASHNAILVEKRLNWEAGWETFRGKMNFF